MNSKYFQIASRGGAVIWGTVQGIGFDSQLCHWNFLLTESFWPHYVQGVYLTSNRNVYREYILECKGGRYVGMVKFPPLYAEFLEI
jgi:hypothetical protein